MKKREESCEYPPRLKIECQQVNSAKSLNSVFKVSKQSKDKSEVVIAQFIVHKKVTGMYSNRSRCTLSDIWNLLNQTHTS